MGGGKGGGGGGLRACRVWGFSLRCRVLGVGRWV